MELLSEDDLNLKEMSPEELDRAWDLWFDLAQTTNDFDPPYSHGAFVLCQPFPPAPEREGAEPADGGEKPARRPPTDQAR